MSLRDEIRRELESMGEPEYRAFSSGLLPGVERIIGVRLPRLRAFAGRIAARKSWRNWLEECLRVSHPEEYFEEVMLQGMVIGCADMESSSPGNAWRKRTSLARAFVPKITNWSVCDSFCSGLKALALDREALREALAPYPRSEREFEARFGAVMIMMYFPEREYLAWALESLDAARHPGYYARMGVAWALSVCYMRFPGETLEYLRSGAPDRETLGMTLRKIRESRRVKGRERERILGFRAALRENEREA